MDKYGGIITHRCVSTERDTVRIKSICGTYYGITAGDIVFKGNTVKYSGK